LRHQLKRAHDEVGDLFQIQMVQIGMAPARSVIVTVMT
jgi:hypothetical protein